jgi:hypothetical protein
MKSRLMGFPYDPAIRSPLCAVKNERNPPTAFLELRRRRFGCGTYRFRATASLPPSICRGRGEEDETELADLGLVAVGQHRQSTASRFTWVPLRRSTSEQEWSPPWRA